MRKFVTCFATAPSLACIAALLPLLAGVDAEGSAKSLDLQYLVYRHADLIVAGHITKAEEPRDGRGRIGIVTVTDVIYGPADLKAVRLELRSSPGEMEYRVGDEGIWFLKQVIGPNAGANQESVAEVRVPDRPRLDVDPSGVFAASHPSTFWALRLAGDAAERRMKWAKMEPRELAELRPLVADRVRADVAALSAALEAARANLERNDAALRRQRDGAKPGDGQRK